MKDDQQQHVQKEKKLIHAYAVKTGMLRFNFMLDCCHPGSVPDPHLIAALLDLVSYKHAHFFTLLMLCYSLVNINFHLFSLACPRY